MATRIDSRLQEQDGVAVNKRSSGLAYWLYAWRPLALGAPCERLASTRVPYTAAQHRGRSAGFRSEQHRSEMLAVSHSMKFTVFAHRVVAPYQRDRLACTPTTEVARAAAVAALLGRGDR
jgi:hypothetical protein